MSKAPVGALVSIYYDGWQECKPGDALKTPAGRVYIVAEVRKQARGKHIGRQHMKCIVAGSTEGVSGKIYPLHWYPRNRR